MEITVRQLELIKEAIVCRLGIIKGDTFRSEWDRQKGPKQLSTDQMRLVIEYEDLLKELGG